MNLNMKCTLVYLILQPKAGLMLGTRDLQLNRLCWVLKSLFHKHMWHMHHLLSKHSMWLQTAHNI